MKNKIRTLVFFFLIRVACFSQDKITWNDLSDVTFSDKYFPSVDDYFLFPSFGKTLKELEGKQIEITGYFLNIDPENGIYLLSRNPMASCFFCGGAGPETIVEVHFKKEVTFKTDQIIQVTGIFKLNEEDINHTNFILEEASGVLYK